MRMTLETDLEFGALSNVNLEPRVLTKAWFARVDALLLQDFSGLLGVARQV